MAWTDIAGTDYERKGVGYESDCTDAEWALIEPFMPDRKRTGRPRTTKLRDIWNAIRSSGIWRRPAASGGCCRAMFLR